MGFQDSANSEGEAHRMDLQVKLKPSGLTLPCRDVPTATYR